MKGRLHRASSRGGRRSLADQAMPPSQTRSEASIPGPVLGSWGACARVTLSWTIAGGVAGGGILVSGLTLTDIVTPGLQLLAAPVLFLVGAALGLAHGCALAVIGRPDRLTRISALRRCVVGGVLAVPALALAWVVTAGISLTAALVHEFRPSVLPLAVGAWIFGLTLCVWAGREGLVALRRAVRRWPESRVGSLLSFGLMIALSAILVADPPVLLGTGLRVNSFGALLLAVAVTLWVGFPILVLLLHLRGHRSASGATGNG